MQQIRPKTGNTIYLRCPPGKWLYLGAALLIVLAYSNSLHSAWHMDDFHTIVNNTHLHLDKITWANLAGIIHPGPAIGTITRFVARLSFAVNWYFSQDKVVPYHLVNLLLHLAVAFFLFRTIILLYRTPVLCKTEARTACFAALFTTLLWAADPVQTQAVTYIAQRMAVMAALFYLLGIYNYLKFRFAGSPTARTMRAAAVGVCFFLALGSKENAATLPLTLLFIEVIFFARGSSGQTHGRALLVLGIGLTVVLLVCCYLWADTGRGITLFSGYQDRYFTLRERLLTELRIVPYYLSLVFYPLPQRLSIAHDITLSHSLFSPVSTFFSLLLIGFLLFVAVWRLQRNPIFSFAILFFFLNQLIESTIIPLELIFEHRNYLPSLFIFWPVVSGIGYLVFRTFRDRKIMAVCLQGGLLALVLLFCTSTFIRNSTWRTDAALWSDARYKAPGRARPLFNLGEMAENDQRFDTALADYAGSLSLTVSSPKYFRSYTYSKIAGIYHRQGKTSKALAAMKQAMQIIPGIPYFLYTTAGILFQADRPKEAEAYLTRLVRNGQAGPKTHALLGRIYLVTGRNSRALAELATAVRKEPEPAVSADFALSLAAAGHFDDAGKVLDLLADQGFSSCTTDLLGIIIEYGKKQGRVNREDMKMIIRDYPLMTIEHSIKRISATEIDPVLLRKIKDLLAAALPAGPFISLPGKGDNV